MLCTLLFSLDFGLYSGAEDFQIVFHTVESGGLRKQALREPPLIHRENTHGPGDGSQEIGCWTIDIC